MKKKIMEKIRNLLAPVIIIDKNKILKPTADSDKSIMLVMKKHLWRQLYSPFRMQLVYKQVTRIIK